MTVSSLLRQRASWWWTLLLFFLLLFGEAASTIDFYTGTVNTAFYESLVSGNSVLDVIYTNFNTTGFLAVGAALLAASGN